MILYLKVVVGVEGGLAWLGERWDEGEVGVWAPGLEMLVHQAGNQQQVLKFKNMKWVQIYTWEVSG